MYNTCRQAILHNIYNRPPRLTRTHIEVCASNASDYVQIRFEADVSDAASEIGKMGGPNGGVDRIDISACRVRVIG